MAKGKYAYEDGGIVTHVFLKQTKHPKRIDVPVRRAVWIDASAYRYEMIEGRMRRVDKGMPQLLRAA